MALIQYKLVLDKKDGYSVTRTVLEVDKGDRIQFKSNVPNAAILYQKDPSFKGSKVPQAKVAFPVGNKGIKGPFTVTKTFTRANRVMFKCGVLQSPQSPEYISGASKPPKFVPWPGKGQGTPDLDL